MELKLEECYKYGTEASPIIVAVVHWGIRTAYICAVSALSHHFPGGPATTSSVSDETRQRPNLRPGS